MRGWDPEQKLGAWTLTRERSHLQLLWARREGKANRKHREIWGWEDGKFPAEGFYFLMKFEESGTCWLWPKVELGGRA